MSLLSLIFRPKRREIFDPNPGEIGWMPARPYRVIHASIPLYSDSECRIEVEGARLIVLRCEDPKQKHQTTECMPTRKRYKVGQLVQWDLNNKSMFGVCWYRNPDTGEKERAWPQAAEFMGNVVRVEEAAAVAGQK